VLLVTPVASMSQSIAITRARDCFPVRRSLLLAVISVVVLGPSGPADARSKAKPAPASSAEVTTPVVPAKATLAAATSASLRTTSGSPTSKAMVEPPTGSILGGITVGKAPTAATADAVVEPVPSATPQRPKDWYPESHSYLRPYHYKWRYWTPG
jgi:hypothetical protein